MEPGERTSCTLEFMNINAIVPAQRKFIRRFTAYLFTTRKTVDVFRVVYTTINSANIANIKYTNIKEAHNSF